MSVNKKKKKKIVINDNSFKLAEVHRVRWNSFAGLCVHKGAFPGQVAGMVLCFGSLVLWFFCPVVALFLLSTVFEYVACAL